MHRIKILFRILVGFYKKIKIDAGLTRIKTLPVDVIDNPQIIVSLTSYGRRVNKVVYYTLVSLLNQKVQPTKIILWLDNENWNIDNLPLKLKRLRKYGIEYNFFDDIKSYKKLIPTLIRYPNETIITVDDDIIYNNDVIENLLTLHTKYPNRIITNGARYPSLIQNDTFSSYRNWETSETIKEKPLYVMPFGGSGTLYPPNSLHGNITNFELAREICPFADDIWFWIMAKMKGTNHIVINNRLCFGYAFDDLYQYFHKGSALTHSNSKMNKNDVQLKNIMDYYNLRPSDLRQN